MVVEKGRRVGRRLEHQTDRSDGLRKAGLRPGLVWNKSQDEGEIINAPIPALGSICPLQDSDESSAA